MWPDAAYIATDSQPGVNEISTVHLYFQKQLTNNIMHCRKHSSCKAG